MNKSKSVSVVLLLGLLATVPLALGADSASVKQPPRSDPKAEQLMQAALDRLASINSLTVEMGVGTEDIDGPFTQTSALTLMRPNFIRLEDIIGTFTKATQVVVAADGKNLWRTDPGDFISYKQPERPENFYLGTNPLVQWFFSGKIAFDPTDQTWGKPISLFDTNHAAYDKFVTLRYVGEIPDGSDKVQELEIRFNSDTDDITEKIYLKNDLIFQIQLDWTTGSKAIFRFNNYQINPVLKPEDFAYTPPPRLPAQDADPVRLGEVAPDFELPLNTGGSIKMSELLKGKKGLLVVTLNGHRGAGCAGPDAYLPTMRLIQEVRDKFKAQGLETIAVVGGENITPEVKDEMLRNWMPDQTRFSYPIALDLDLERGIQGSAYQNFQLNGRNNILLDKDGRVVFACQDFDVARVNELSLYQALSSMGFAVSPADLEIKSADKIYR